MSSPHEQLAVDELEPPAVHHAEGRRGIVRVSHAIARGEVVVVALLLGALVVCALTQVVSRYVFDNSLAWTEELARVLFVAGTFLGASAAIALRREIKVDVLHPALRPVRRRNPEAAQRVTLAADLAAPSASVALAVLMLWLSWEYVAFQAAGTSMSTAMQVPSWWLVAVLPVAFALAAFHYAAAVVEVLQERAAAHRAAADGPT